jgi:hypothetical protein
MTGYPNPIHEEWKNREVDKLSALKRQRDLSTYDAALFMQEKGFTVVEAVMLLIERKG